MRQFCLKLFWLICIFSAHSSRSQVSLLNENFNGPVTPAGWTVINNSVGGNISEGGGGPDSAAWTLRADGYHYTSVFLNPIFHSNDGSQFYLSNSDAQGYDDPDPQTNTILKLPSISTMGYQNITLKFYHNFWSAGNPDYALVEVSTNGTDWTAVYTAHDQDNYQIGTSEAFVLETVNLNSYNNIPNLRLRFHYLASFGNYWAIDNVSLTATGTGSCPSNNWEGLVSTAWENSANWSCGTVPDASTTVNINPGKPNYPVINSMATCKTLNSYPGTSVTISTGSRLDITGP